MNSLLLSFFPSFLLPPPVYNCEICPRLSLKCSVGLEHSYSVASKPRTGQKRSQNRIGARGFASFCPTLAVFITPITEQRTTRHSPLFSPVKTSSAKKKKRKKKINSQRHQENVGPVNAEALPKWVDGIGQSS